jgi:tetratricopeptide (TPR) repeat protein
MPLETVPEPGLVPPGSVLRWASTPRFVGRTDDLRALARALQAGEDAAIVPLAVATGWGGVGKTQLAAEFALRYGRYFAGGVHWVNASSPETLREDIAACGGPAGLGLFSGEEKLTLDEQALQVRIAWSSPTPRLVVFDDCEDEALLDAWRPPSGGTCLLLTSRRTAWRPDIGMRVHQIDVLARPKSVDLLRAGRPDLAPDHRTLDAIAEELGDLPLALHLASRYLERYRRVEAGAPAQYLEALRASGLLAHSSMSSGEGSPTGHIQNVARTFAVSYDRLRDDATTDALARVALAFAAWLAPGETIERSFLEALVTLDLSNGFASDEQVTIEQGALFEDAIFRLYELGLIDELPDGDLSIHRLLGRFVRDRDVEQALRGRMERWLAYGANALNGGEDPRAIASWGGHFRYAVDAAAERVSEEAGSLLRQFSRFAFQSNQFGQAVAYGERAVAAIERSHGAEDRLLASALNDHGMALKASGAFDKAVARLRRAIEVADKACGPEDLGTVPLLLNLADALQGCREPAGALDCLDRAEDLVDAAIDARSPDDPLLGRFRLRVTVGRSHLLLIFDPERGLDEVAEVIAWAVRHFGPEWPELRDAYRSLGDLYFDTGQWERAIPIYARALALSHRHLGRDAVATAEAASGLGRSLAATGRFADARDALEEAVAIGDGFKGATLAVAPPALAALAHVYAELGMPTAALQIVDRARASDGRLWLGEAVYARLVLVRGESLLALGRRGDARTALAETEALLLEADMPDFLDLHRARIALASLDERVGMRTSRHFTNIENLRSGGDADPQALGLLCVAAVLEPAQRIEREFLRVAWVLASGIVDESDVSVTTAFEAAVGRLKEAQLIEIDQEGSLRLCPAVAAAIRGFDDGNAWRDATEEAVLILAHQLNATEDAREIAPWGGHLCYVAEVAIDRGAEIGPFLLVEWGKHLYHHGSYTIALDSLRRGAALIETAHGANDSRLPPVLNALALACRITGKCDEAAELLHRLIVIAEASGDTAPEIHVNLGFALEDRTAAADAFRRGVAGARLLPETPETIALLVRALTGLGGVLRQMGQCEAQEVLEEALALGTARLGENHPVLQQSLAGLGHLHVRAGKYMDAQRCLERSIEIGIAVHGERDPLLGDAYLSLAHARFEQGDVAGAEEALDPAMTLALSTVGPVHPNVVQGLDLAAQIAFEQRDPKMALSILERLIPLREETEGRQAPRLMWPYITLGSIYERLGRAEEARGCFYRAIAVAKRQRPIDRGIIARAQDGLDRLKVSEG